MKQTIRAIISAGIIGAASGCDVNNSQYSFPEPQPASAASTESQAEHSNYTYVDAARIAGSGNTIEAPAAPMGTAVQATPPVESPAGLTKEKHKLDFLFAYNSATQFLDTNGKPLTREAVKAQLTDYISKVGNDAVYVDGFASIEGNYKHNLELSKERAKTLASLLCDVKFARNFTNVEVRGLGETQIFADKLTADELKVVEKLPLEKRINYPNLQKNRRVTLTNKMRKNGYTPAEATTHAGACKDLSAKLKPAKQVTSLSNEIIRKFPESNTDNTYRSNGWRELPLEAPSLFEHYEALPAVKSTKALAIDTMIAGVQRTVGFYNQRLSIVDTKLADLEARCRPGMPDMKRPVKGYMTGKNNDSNVYTIYGPSKCQEAYSNLTAELEGSLVNLERAVMTLKKVNQAVLDLPDAESRVYSSQIEDLATKASQVSASYKNKETRAKSESRALSGSERHGSVQRRNIYDNMRLAQVEFMHSQGISYEEIGKALNISAEQIDSYVRQPKAA